MKSGAAGRFAPASPLENVHVDDIAHNEHGAHSMDILACDTSPFRGHARGAIYFLRSPQKTGMWKDDDQIFELQTDSHANCKQYSHLILNENA